MEEIDNICFVCDKNIPSDKWKYQLQVTATKKRNAPVADLIQDLVGDEFEVLVGERDAICSRCMNLLNQMDSLTVQLGQVKSTLTQFLQAKYSLTSEDIELQVQYDDTTVKEQEPLHKCEVCAFQTKYEKEYNKHIRTHVSPKPSSKSASVQKPAKSNIPNDIKSNEPKTQKKSGTKHSPELNNSTIGKKSSLIPPTSRLRNTTPKYLRQKQKKKKIVFQCSLCNDVFSTETAIRLHCKKEHGNDKIVVSDDEYEDVQTLEPAVEDIFVEKKSTKKVKNSVPSKKKATPPVKKKTTPKKKNKNPAKRSKTSKVTKLDFLDDWVEDEDNDDLNSPVKKPKIEEDSTIGKKRELSFRSSLRESFDDPEVEEEENYDKEHSSNPTCMFCQAKFSSLIAVQDHVKLSHRDKSNLSSSSKTQTSNVNSVASFEIDSTTDIAEDKKQIQHKRNKKSYRCYICGIRKVSLQFIKKHVKAHKRKMSLQCQRCGICFKNIVSLKVHSYKCLKVGSVFKKCNFCKFKFSNLLLLKNHISKVHRKKRSKCSSVTDMKSTVKSQLIDPKSNLKGSSSIKNGTITKTDSSKISVSEVSSTSIETDIKQKVVCFFCEFETATDSEMKDHLEKYHEINDIKNKEEILGSGAIKKPTTVEYRCSECNIRYSKPSQLITHENRHKANTCMNLGICVYCQKLFLNKEQLIIHTNTVHEKLKLKPLCPVCHKLYAHIKDLKIHYLRVHFGDSGEKLLKQVIDQKRNKKESVLNANDVYSKVFKELQDLTGEGNDTEDMLMEDNSEVLVNYNCPICEFNSQNEDSVKSHLPSHAQYYCKICENIFGTEEVIKHLENHAIDFQDVKCSECEKGFHDSIHLQVHVQFAHPEAKPHKCSMCEKTYLTQKSMLQHKQTKHGEDTRRAFSCNKCKLVFYSERTYHTHVEFAHRLSSNCKYCDKSFSSTKKLISHEKDHLKQAKNIYKCNICGKVLKSRPALKAHRKIHTASRPLTCEVCKMNFKSFYSLREHSAKHSGVQEKKYFCEICGKGFYFYDSHQRHRKIHLDPLLFQCKSCKERFPTKQKLTEHQKNCDVGSKPSS